MAHLRPIACRKCNATFTPNVSKRVNCFDCKPSSSLASSQTASTSGGAPDESRVDGSGITAPPDARRLADLIARVEELRRYAAAIQRLPCADAIDAHLDSVAHLLTRQPLTAATPAPSAVGSEHIADAQPTSVAPTTVHVPTQLLPSTIEPLVEPVQNDSGDESELALRRREEGAADESSTEDNLVPANVERRIAALLAPFFRGMNERVSSLESAFATGSHGGSPPVAQPAAADESVRVVPRIVCAPPDAAANTERPRPSYFGISDDTCRNCRAVGHWGNDCTSPPRCIKCNELGHKSPDCASIRRGRASFFPAQPSTASSECQRQGNGSGRLP